MTFCKSREPTFCVIHCKPRGERREKLEAEPIYFESPSSLITSVENLSANSASLANASVLLLEPSPEACRMASIRSMRCSIDDSCSGLFIFGAFFSTGAKVHAALEAKQ